VPAGKAGYKPEIILNNQLDLLPIKMRRWRWLLAGSLMRIIKIIRHSQVQNSSTLHWLLEAPQAACQRSCNKLKRWTDCWLRVLSLWENKYRMRVQIRNSDLVYRQLKNPDTEATSDQKILTRFRGALIRARLINRQTFVTDCRAKI